MPLLNDIKEIASSQDTCLALSSKGTLYEMTRHDGAFSKVKLSCISLPIVSFSTSSTHCIALDKAGCVWVWG
jgi:alpha-tubulin suppressor-like RCC1 family protein